MVTKINFDVPVTKVTFFPKLQIFPKTTFATMIITVATGNGC